MRLEEQTIQIPRSSSNIYSVLQQEVEIGTRALREKRADVAVTMFQSSLEKLTVEDPFYDHLVYNLLMSYKVLIGQLLDAGDRSMAMDFMAAALSLEIAGKMAEDRDFVKRFAGAFESTGLLFFKKQYFRESTSCFRKAVAAYPTPVGLVNLTNALTATGERARLSDFTNEVATEQLGRHIFIACLPKSASTFLKNLLVSLTGYRDVFMVYAAGQSEHELYLPTLRENATIDSVTQQHCRASDANVQIMQGFGIKPVVLVRNIFDSVMSLLDFYNSGASNNTFFRADFLSFDEETKVDLIIDNVIPWYFQFVASWELVEKNKRLDLIWLTYEEFISDKPAAVKKVLEFYGLGASAKSVMQKIRATEAQQRSIRFNKGVAGRGISNLSERQKEAIRRFARFYPTTDFSRIGL